MREEDVRALVEKVMNTKAETQDVEVKAAAKGTPKLYDTLSSFSNQRQGGTILFGIDEKSGFSLVGVYDAHDLQKNVGEQCKEMEPPVRALFSTAVIRGKTVVTAEIPSVEESRKPVHYKGAGRLWGSYVRVGDSDERMSEYEVYSMEAFRRRVNEDLRVVENADLSLLDENLVAQFIQTVRRRSDNLRESVDDAKILELMRVTKGGKPTLAGWMVFSLYPQSLFPQLSVTAVVVPGFEMGDADESGKRFFHDKRITGPISDMLRNSLEFVIRNSGQGVAFGEDGMRRTIKEYPLVAVREAVLNALLHRDYSQYSENSPVRIVMYNDRLEISNRGGIYGGYPVESLGEVCPETRNASLAEMLEILEIAENRYSGVHAMRKACADAGLPEPEFSVRAGDFTVTFRNKLHAAPKAEGVEKRVLDFCDKPKSRAEIAAHVGIGTYYLTKEVLNPMVEKGLLVMTLPDKPRSRYQGFYRP